MIEKRRWANEDAATYVNTIDRIPPPAPARAWATLSFWGRTGLDRDIATGTIACVLRDSLLG